MGLVMTKVKLTHLLDLEAARRGRIPPEAVSSVEIDAVADTPEHPDGAVSPLLAAS